MRQNLTFFTDMPARSSYFALPVVQTKKKKSCCKKFKKGKRCRSCPGRKKD